MLLNLFIKNRITAVLILTAACGLAAWGYNYKSKGALFRKAVAVNSRSLAAPIGVDQPSPTITVFTAPGMSVAVTSAQVGKTGLAPEVNCAVMNNGGEDTDEIELLLLDFTAEGKIDGIVGRKFSASLKPRGTRNLSFTTDRPLQSNHSLTLTVRKPSNIGTVPGAVATGRRRRERFDGRPVATAPGTVPPRVPMLSGPI